MHIIGFDDFRNTEIITREGYIIGTTFDLKYNPGSWKIRGIRFSPSPSMKKLYPSIIRRVMLAPSTKYTIKDVILTEMNTNDLITKFMDEPPELESLANILGKIVMTKDEIMLGTVSSVHIDLDEWYVKSLSVKLDKNVHKEFGIRRKLFISRVVSGLLTQFIKNVGEKVSLGISMKQVKSQVIIEE